MRSSFVVSSSALILLLASAQSAPAQQPKEKSCPAQIEELCPETEPKSPERRACVRQNADKLSARCQQQLGRATPAAKPPDLRHFQQFLQACANDRSRVVELCQKNQPPDANLAECLRANQSEFSKPCQDWIRADASAAAGKPQPVDSRAAAP